VISFWVPHAGVKSIANYRGRRGQAIADRFQIRAYEDIEETTRLSTGPQLFTALDRLTDRGRALVANLWDAHASTVPSAQRLNDPRRVMLRYDLLNELHRAGINNFGVFRPDQAKSLRRFPVFVRQANDHNGPQTRLLHTQSEVTAAIRALRLRGHRLEDLMIVEYCDTSGPDGLFRKYAAFKVARHILPCHVMASRYWKVKSDRSELSAERVREGLAYLEENPHAAWLHRVFAIAGTDYGRADYGVVDGVPQLWEINLNPTIGGGSTTRRAAVDADLHAQREREREVFHRRLRDAFVELDDRPCRQFDAPVDRGLVVRLRADAARTGRRHRFLSRLRQLYHHRHLGRPVRAVYTRLFPRR
jgi:hypothetical protein